MNFALIMLIALVVTGAIWLLDLWVLRRRRAPGAKEPTLVEYSRSFFPVILIVFLLRSFLVEPFKIPSGSMIPTLLVGDFILVNKFVYGLRLPVVNQKFMEVDSPARGDVMVFRFPRDPSTDYIKRVIGLPGDVVTYRDKRLSINGVPVPLRPAGAYAYMANGQSYVTAQAFHEKLDGDWHRIITVPQMPGFLPSQVIVTPQYVNRCEFDDQGFACRVPSGQYFVMGDNRDSSNDSRYWGFVPERNIVGRAFMIWWNFSDLGRIGLGVH